MQDYSQCNYCETYYPSEQIKDGGCPFCLEVVYDTDDEKLVEQINGQQTIIDRRKSRIPLKSTLISLLTKDSEDENVVLVGLTCFNCHKKVDNIMISRSVAKRAIKTLRTQSARSHYTLSDCIISELGTNPYSGDQLYMLDTNMCRKCAETVEEVEVEDV